MKKPAGMESVEPDGCSKRLFLTTFFSTIFLNRLCFTERRPLRPSRQTKRSFHVNREICHVATMTTATVLIFVLSFQLFVASFIPEIQVLPKRCLTQVVFLYQI